MTQGEDFRTENSPKVDWDNPKIPAGDSPTLPAWPLWLSGMLWGGFAVFLLIKATRG